MSVGMQDIALAVKKPDKGRVRIPLELCWSVCMSEHFSSKTSFQDSLMISITLTRLMSSKLCLEEVLCDVGQSR